MSVACHPAHADLAPRSQIAAGDSPITDVPVAVMSRDAVFEWAIQVAGLREEEALKLWQSDVSGDVLVGVEEETLATACGLTIGSRFKLMSALKRSPPHAASRL